MDTTFNITLSMYREAPNLDALFAWVDESVREVINDSPVQEARVLEVRMDDVRYVLAKDAEGAEVGYDLHARVYVEIECKGVSEDIIED